MTGGVIKFSVLHGKRAAVIEMPSSATVGALAAELATRFKLDHPTAIKFKLPDSDASLRVQDYPDATLESSGFASGMKVRMKVSKSLSAAAAAAEDGGAGSAAAAPVPSAAASDAKFVKGQPVLYRTREGTWQEAKVVDVDYSVLPFSYGIEIDGRYRETEATRLAPLPQGQQAPA